ncbi:ankyrin repeat domain-containing protein [Endozoicomonas sp. ALD040]|uniref:ankyrin repeat domain-containing protein n=1 Tax=Endozoicomonas sp. ALD040 TaxID=3403079 RepID=UPI003BB09E6B
MFFLRIALLSILSPWTLKADQCPICLACFHGRSLPAVIVKTQCCGHRFDLDCISRCFVDQPIGSRRCAMCRQDPMPLVNLNTGESHPDTFFPDQAFYDACVDGELNQVERSVAEGVNVNAITHGDFTALMIASYRGHKAIVECLISAGANLNAASEAGATALFLAAQENYTDCVKLLINAGADLNAGTEDGSTPLSMAAQEGNIDCVKALIEANADPNTGHKSGITPSLLAAQENNADCLKLLI